MQNHATTHTTNTTLYLSKRGVKELRKHISRLEIQHAKAMDELRELDRTDAHEERLARIEKLAMIDLIDNELAHKKEQLENAKPLPRKRDAIRVAIGSVVDLMDQHGRMMRYTLVNSIEANPSDGRISIVSPLGQSLLGKTAKQTVEWTSNRLQTRRMQLVRVH